jgi:hypothetical protein
MNETGKTLKPKVKCIINLQNVEARRTIMKIRNLFLAAVLLSILSSMPVFAWDYEADRQRQEADRQRRENWHLKMERDQAQQDADRYRRDSQDSYQPYQSPLSR